MHKTWLNITKSIQDIKKNIQRMRHGFVTMSKVPKQINIMMHDIEDALAGIHDVIILQQKMTSFEYPLGDIISNTVSFLTKPVKTLNIAR